MKDVPGFLQQSQSSGPGQAAVWHRLEELYNKKLWHQLTLQVLDFVQDPCFAQGDGLIKLYENFISEFEHRVNPLSLVEIILHVVRQMTDPNVALTFLEKTREKVKSSDEAVILCKTAIGALKLNIGDLQVTKETIEEVEEMLNNLPGVTSVHSRFYDLSSKYYQTIGNHASYYKDALRFLGCIDVKDLPVSEQQERAFTLGLAGLLGEGVYNFGELLMHPVLESLRSTDRQWLIDTLYAFNSGNVETFQALKSAWGQQPDLAANEALLLQKIQLLCLMEMTFTRPANHRQLTFEEIAKSAKVTVNEVELLVMKALSVGLVKGSIDEVDKRVHMTWVQPRVLDLQQGWKVTVHAESLTRADLNGGSLRVTAWMRNSPLQPHSCQMDAPWGRGTEIWGSTAAATTDGLSWLLSITPCLSVMILSGKSEQLVTFSQQRGLGHGVSQSSWA